MSAPPEIRLLRSGVIETRKGPFLVDAESCTRVMHHFEEHGARVAIDLAHNDQKLCGSAALEIRAGELWAVAISWTADGARRVVEGLERFVSPDILWERLPNGQRRVVAVLSFAICSEPEMLDAPAFGPPSEAELAAEAAFRTFSGKP